MTFPGLPPRTRLRLVPLAALFAVIAGYGIWRIHEEYPAHWAYALTQGGSQDSTQIKKTLDHIGDADGPTIEKPLPLAEFVQSNGHRIRVDLVVGQFFSTSIEPRELWKTLGKSILLVSSVDERRSSIGGLSSAITTGCAIAPEFDVTQELGSASIDQCRGVYGKYFNVTHVARISAIIDSAPNSDKQPCWDRFGLTDDAAGYQTCVANAVSSGLGEIFAESQRYTSLDAMVFPAIGTGTGRLSKAAFYNALLVETLVPQLHEDHQIPATIYLQVPRTDSSRWPETKTAIAGALFTAITNWDFKTDHKGPDSAWLSLTGVMLGASLLLVVVMLGLGYLLPSSMLPILTSSRPLVIVGWISVAVGLASGFSAAAALLPDHLNPYLQVVAGALAALLSGSLTRAGRQVTDLLQGVSSEGGSLPTEPPAVTSGEQRD